MYFYNGFYWYQGNMCKWYDYEKDILHVSNKFPDVLITVNGNGEDDDDKWVQYFLGGMKTPVYQAKIVVTYKEFDKTALE